MLDKRFNFVVGQFTKSLPAISPLTSVGSDSFLRQLANWNKLFPPVKFRGIHWRKCNHEQKGAEWKTAVTENHCCTHLDMSFLSDLCPVRSHAEEERPSLRKTPYISLLGIPEWHHMSISSAGESDATRWKPRPLVPVYSPDHPRGLLPLLLNHTPCPNPSSLSFSSVTSLIFSVLTITSRGPVWNTVFILTVVHLCNKIKWSPLLPDLIRRTSRFIWKSSQHSWFFKTNVTVCFLSLRSSLTCPHCLKQSNTFDPFLCISLPIPLRQTRWALLKHPNKWLTW